MIDLKWIKQRETEIYAKTQKRLAAHLDLLDTLLEAILYGVNLILSSSSPVDLDNQKDRIAFLSIICASRIVSLARSSIQQCCNGYGLEATILARSMFEISIMYEYLLLNPIEADLFAEDKLSTAEIVKRAIKSKRLTGDVDTGPIYGILSEFVHHSQWALAHTFEWEEGDKSFVEFRMLIDDPEVLDPALRYVFQSALRFYNLFYNFVRSEFHSDEDWDDDYSFISEYQDIFQAKGDKASEDQG